MFSFSWPRSSQYAKRPHRKYTSLESVQKKHVQFGKMTKRQGVELLISAEVTHSVPKAFDTNRCKREALCDTCQSVVNLPIPLSSSTAAHHLPSTQCKIGEERNGG